MFLISLLLSLMMIISRSYKQKKGTYTLLGKRVGGLDPQEALRSCVPDIELSKIFFSFYVMNFSFLYGIVWNIKNLCHSSLYFRRPCREIYRQIPIEKASNYLY